MARRGHGFVHGRIVCRLSQRVARPVEYVRPLLVPGYMLSQRSSSKVANNLPFFFLIQIDHKVLSCVATHAAGLILLSLCYCAHSILVRGVYLDAEEPGASAAVLPYFYTRYFIQVFGKRR